MISRALNYQPGLLFGLIYLKMVFNDTLTAIKIVVI